MRRALRITHAVLIKEESIALAVKEKLNNRVILHQPTGHLELGGSLIERVIREVQSNVVDLVNAKN